MKLSPRQREIANLIADGKSAPEIAKSLGIGLGTVKTQIVRLKAKKGLKSQVEIAQWVWNKRNRTSRIYKGIQAAT